MNLRIIEVDATRMSDVNLIDSIFRVEARLRLRSDGDAISYAIEPVEPYEKRYPDETGGVAPASVVDGGDGVIYLAYADQAPIGQIIAGRDWTGYARVHDIRVAPAYRGQHLGRALMDRVREWARLHGMAGLVVETQNVNVPACLFYQAYGFELGGFDTLLYRGLDPATDEVAIHWYLRF
jgi:streptothricin acetyltransferase